MSSSWNDHGPYSIYGWFFISTFALITFQFVLFDCKIRNFDWWKPTCFFLSVETRASFQDRSSCLVYTLPLMLRLTSLFFPNSVSLGSSAIVKVSSEQPKSGLSKFPRSQEGVPKQGSQRFPGRGSQARFPSKVPRKRFPSKVPRQGSQARFQRFPGTGRGSQARFPSKVPKQGSQARFSSKVPKQGSQARFSRAGS